MKIAVIPARGGSKRIPRKNIKHFCGKPIIAYSIEAALQSDCFDRIIVSTDDREIADIAKDYGAEIPFFRPRALSGDFTGTNAVVKHAIEWYKTQGLSIDQACCIYATAPFINIQTIQKGEVLLNGSSEKMFAFTATSFPFPIQRAFKLQKYSSIQMFYPKHIMTRSQDLEEAYHDAGQIYWGKASAFLNDLPIFSSRSIPIMIPRYRVQDIDTLEDWQRAELMMKVLIKEKECKNI